MRLYVAGPLFTQAERAWNERLAAALADAGHDVFLPQSEVKAIASLDADTIFQVDIDGVRSAEAVVAILDGADPDSGTCFIRLLWSPVWFRTGCELRLAALAPAVLAWHQARPRAGFSGRRAAGNTRGWRR